MAVMVAEKRMAMSGLKIYNILNGGFYILYGLWGVILPSRIAGFMGWDTVTALGVHQIRALWTGLFAIGAASYLEHWHWHQVDYWDWPSMARSSKPISKSVSRLFGLAWAFCCIGA